MLTACNDAGRVERMPKEGGLSCPGYGCRHGRERAVSGSADMPDGTAAAVPVHGMRMTHMLPARLLLRRRDEAPVIGAALTVAKAQVHRRVAGELRGPGGYGAWLAAPGRRVGRAGPGGLRPSWRLRWLGGSGARPFGLST